MALFWPKFWGSPLTWSIIKTICKQPSQVSIFTNSRISTLSGLRGVSGTSDWSEEKEKKEKSAQIEYEQMKVEPLCTTKLQTFEKLS